MPLDQVYKERAVLHQFQTVLMRRREELMEKVGREEEERPIIFSFPFDHYKLLLS